ncbi:transporter substrate-binding domain-containing protein [Photobacterium makurazakiensis]|uniref:transporter substrate-binding domain-containing protein n=1 Tax=Photobacterium makurazakiensis TaxID=2910234 RepID=UPI003D09FE70
MKTKMLKSLTHSLFIAGSLFYSQNILAYDLPEIKESGVIRHIGVPYANFVSYIKRGDFESLSGLDVELIKGFAKHIGVEYQYVPAEWHDVIGKLIGQDVLYSNNKFSWGDKRTVEGDIIANGATILEWRTELADFSDDYFISGVWLVARSDSDLSPIEPAESIDADISSVKRMIRGKDVLALEFSCLDPNLYNLYETGANVILPEPDRKLNEMVPAILKNDAETTLLDVADALIALEKWPGEIKVIGPISQEQKMGAAFRKSSPLLRQAFNEYLDGIRKDGSFQKLVKKHYPSIFYFYGDYFMDGTTKDL